MRGFVRDRRREYPRHLGEGRREEKENGTIVPTMDDGGFWKCTFTCNSTLLEE